MKKFNVKVNGVSYEVEIEEIDENNVQNITCKVPSTSPVQTTTSSPTISTPPQPQVQTPPPAKAKQSADTINGQKVTAPMPGKIMTICFAQGETVKKGEPVVILEAMKMQNELLSPCDGVVQSLNISEGQNVKSGEVIMIIG